MTIACPKCSGTMRSNGIRKTAKGSYRKMLCMSCGYHEKHKIDGTGKLPPSNRKFDAQRIREILRAEGTLHEIGQRFGCHRETVRQIRAGKAYKDLLPYGYLLKDAAGPRCDKCQHWQKDHCGMGFPDPIEEGLYFARDCAVWVEVGA